jgi:hypothetical protein
MPRALLHHPTERSSRLFNSDRIRFANEDDVKLDSRRRDWRGRQESGKIRDMPAATARGADGLGN